MNHDAEQEAWFLLGGLRLRFRFSLVHANTVSAFLEDLEPFRAENGEADLDVSVGPAGRGPAKAVDEGLARAIWAPLHRFPFEQRASSWFDIRLRHARAFAGSPQAARTYRRAFETGWEKVLAIFSDHGPAVFFPEDGTAEVFLDPSRQRLEAPHLRALFFQILSASVATRDGVLVHGAGVARDGKGHAFLGLSGAGKSTAGRLFGGALFGDDGLILRRTGGAFRVFATPFCQQKESEAYRRGLDLDSAPLNGLFFLEQAPEHRLSPVPGPESALKILQHDIHYFRFLPDALAEMAFHTVTDLVKNHPVQTLHFRKDAGFRELVE